MFAVSQKVDDFRQRMGMTVDEVNPLRQALGAVEDGNSGDMKDLGMPPHAWHEVSFIFHKLIKSGFTA
jgi:hypothetical protein